MRITRNPPKGPYPGMVKVHTKDGRDIRIHGSWTNAEVRRAIEGMAK